MQLRWRPEYARHLPAELSGCVNAPAIVHLSQSAIGAARVVGVLSNRALGSALAACSAVTRPQRFGANECPQST